MSYGTPDWQGWVLDEEESLPLLEHAYKVGIRTWDTADIYSHGKSEEIMYVCRLPCYSHPSFIRC